MDGIEITEFMQDQQTGVLSMGKDDEGYGIPVSFAYDDADPAVYLRLGYGPNSQKREFVEATDRVSLAVYDHTDEGWKSVVVEGEIEHLTESTLESSVLESVRDLEIPFVRVFDRDSDQLEFRIARIDVGAINGILAG